MAGHNGPAEKPGCLSTFDLSEKDILRPALGPREAAPVGQRIMGGGTGPQGRRCLVSAERGKAGGWTPLEKGRDEGSWISLMGFYVYFFSCFLKLSMKFPFKNKPHVKTSTKITFHVQVHIFSLDQQRTRTGGLCGRQTLSRGLQTERRSVHPGPRGFCTLKHRIESFHR